MLVVRKKMRKKEKKKEKQVIQMRQFKMETDLFSVVTSNQDG